MYNLFKIKVYSLRVCRSKRTLGNSLFYAVNFARREIIVPKDPYNHYLGISRNVQGFFNIIFMFRNIVIYRRKSNDVTDKKLCLKILYEEMNKWKQKLPMRFKMIIQMTSLIVSVVVV